MQCWGYRLGCCLWSGEYSGIFILQQRGLFLGSANTDTLSGDGRRCTNRNNSPISLSASPPSAPYSYSCLLSSSLSLHWGPSSLSSVLFILSLNISFIFSQCDYVYRDFSSPSLCVLPPAGALCPAFCLENYTRIFKHGVKSCSP